jgi:hypothetical protein
MKKVMIILALIVMNCLNTQRGRCEKRLVDRNQSMSDCIDSLKSFPALNSIDQEFNERNNTTGPTRTSEALRARGLSTCIIAIEKERECKKKSEYIPTFD